MMPGVSDGLHGGSNAFEMLNIHGGEYVDPSIQQLKYILVAFTMLAAFNVGMREFIDNSNARVSSQNRIHVHLFEQCASVLNLFARNLLQLTSQFGGHFTAVRFDHADHNVFIAAVAPDRLAQHVIGLSDTRCISQKKFEDAPLTRG